MAKEAPKKAEAAEGEAPAKSGGKKKMMLIIIIAVVLAAVLGAGAMMMLAGGNKADGESADAEAAHEEAEEKPEHHLDPSKPPVFVALDPFTVNLQSESGERYLQVVATLRVVDDHVGEELKLYMPEIRHRILILLSSKRAEEISTAEDREHLAEEIQVEANDALGYTPTPGKKRRKGEPEPTGPVVSVFFTQFIVQ